MSIEIRPLTPELFPALELMFGEGGDPSWCWCMFFRTQGSDGGRQDRAANRQRLEALTNDGVLTPGLVAVDGEQVVGWVSLGPRDDFLRLERSRVMATVDDTPVWSAVCFVVSRSARGKGMMGILLEGAIAFARDSGATMLEAYPLDPGAGRLSSGDAYSGVPSVFERAGFRTVATRTATATSKPRRVMRLDLARG
jgi:GNAT superfamily N-acetyltransferase